MITLKRGAVLAAPAAVPASMALVFRWLSHRLSPQAAYNAGFIIYWLAGCIGFPMVVLGPRRAARLLTQGRRPSGVEMIVVDLARGWRGEQRAATESQQDRRDACRGDGDNRGDQCHRGGAVMARRLSPGVPSRSAVGAAVAACRVLSLASRTTDDLAFSARPLAVHAGRRSGRLGIGV